MIGMTMPLTKTQAEGLAAMAVMAVMFYVFLLIVPFFRPSSASSVPFSAKEAGMLVVALNVDQQERGVYFVPPGTTVAGFLSASGAAALHFEGSVGDRHLVDGDKVYLTSASKSSVHIGRISGAQSLALDLPLDINRVSLDELVLVPGIGDQTAGKIIALRRSKERFRSMDDLKEIRGIKEKKLAHFSRYLRILP